MSFDRHHSQVQFESIFGCNGFEEFYNLPHSQIEEFALTIANASGIKSTLREDAKDLYFKGCQSLTESLLGFSKRLYSWAIVKAYYSVFYMVKADFALRDFALVKHRCIYYIEAIEGAKPKTKGRTSSNRRDYTGDHKAALNYYKDLFSNSDILLSQEIEGLTSYNWLMKKREQINYQEREFREPFRPDFLDYIDKRVIAGEFQMLIEEIKNDSRYVLTFQSEFAPIAIPYKRAMLTKQSFINNGITDILPPHQTEVLNSFAPHSFM